MAVERFEIGGKNREVDKTLEHVWEIAREFGLDPHPTNFNIVPPHVINEVGAYSLPRRFSHWTFGRSYRMLKTLGDHGFQKIYEVVVNGNPSEAFLMDSNVEAINKLVMAHVLGHTDFFKNNYLFVDTPKDMVAISGVHADRIREHESSEGRLAVEEFLDAVISLEDHVDFHAPTRLSKEELLRKWKQELREKERSLAPKGEYDDLFEKSQKKEPRDSLKLKIPPEVDKDLLGFIRDFSPYLADWQRDIIDIVRSEALYFGPKKRTKIMNEGWATYWHKRIMREMGNRGYITPEEDGDWSLNHAGIVTPIKQGLNPYYFGMKMYEYIEDYYNGNLDSEETRWLEDNDLPTYQKYHGEWRDSPGVAKVFEVRAFENDQSFIRNNFNKIPADRMNMFIFDEVESNGRKYISVREKGWEEIRDHLVGSMTNAGDPYIVVEDGDYLGRGELFLKHQYEGKELDLRYLARTLPLIHRLWGKPVSIGTVVAGKNKVFSYEGHEVTQKDL